TGLRADPAVRLRSRRRHLPPGDLPPVDRARAVVGGLRATVAPADRWPLRRQPEPPAALLPVPEQREAEPGRYPRTLQRFTARARHRPAGTRPAVRRGQLGIADARRVGPRLGSLAERHGSHPVHVLPAGRRPRMSTGDRRDHLRPRTPRDVPAERRQRVRPRVDARAARRGELRRRVPPERGRTEHLQFRARERREAVRLVRYLRGGGDAPRRSRPAAAGLRAGHEGEPHVQPARRAPRDQRDRAPALHPARARAVARRRTGLLRAARKARLPGFEREGGRMMATTHSLLIEIGTEELPPKALDELAGAFTRGVCDGLVQRGIAADVAHARTCCSPRRLATWIPGVAPTQPDQMQERRGPALSAGLDANGEPTRALTGFAQSCGVDVAALEKLETDKGAWFVYRANRPGART